MSIEKNSKDAKSEFEAVYRQELNRHGYAFQNSVIRTAVELFEQRKSPWVFRAAEFPVSVRGKVTHIDFIFEHNTQPLYLIGECKRVNPAFSTWCFARSSFTRRNPNNTKLIIQTTWRSETASKTVLTGIRLESSDQIYHLGLEIKSNKEGRGSGTTERCGSRKGRGASLLGNQWNG
jgi:hypothetical protein